MPRTKKTPTSQSLAADATKGPSSSPKGTAPSLPPASVEGCQSAKAAKKSVPGKLAPFNSASSLEERVAVPLVAIDADAIYRTRGLIPRAETAR